MNIVIDIDVTFTLAGDGRKLTLDALELEDFVQSLWGAPKEKKDNNGNVIMQDGVPAMVRTLGDEWENVIDQQFGDWLRARANGMNPPLKRSEVRIIWVEVNKQDDKGNSLSPWAKKNEISRKQALESDSQTSQPSSDPRYSA